MRWYMTFPFIALCFGLGVVTRAHGDSTSSAELPEVSRTVLALSELKFYGVGSKILYGTGFCLDMACRFVGTNYHVAVEAHPRKIKGKQVLATYLATGPNDEDATQNDAASRLVKPRKYNIGRDLAIYELREPIGGHQGLPYSLMELQAGDQVVIYGFPKNRGPKRELVAFPATFVRETSDSRLVLRIDDLGLHAGTSGGIVVKAGKIVGIFNAIGTEDEHIALAVKAQTLADFLAKAQPYLHAQLFPEDVQVSPLSADLYPPYIFPPVNGRRPLDPPDVTALRKKAQALADNIYNFVAVQSFTWGIENNVPQREARYEVRMIDGNQRFREYPDGKKLYDEVPLPTLNNVMAPGREWSLLPQLVGTQLDLKIHQAEDKSVGGETVKVFQWRADSEDNLCVFKSTMDFVFFSHSKTSSFSCYGEVWTDQDFNILRISDHFDLVGRWEGYESVVTYGWLTQGAKMLTSIPVTIVSQAILHGKVHWCRGQFTGYQMFSSKVKILAGSLDP